MAYNQARRHPFLRGRPRGAGRVHDPRPGEQPRHDPRPRPPHVRGRLPVRPPDVGDARDEGVPLRREGPRLQRHRELEADGAAGGPLLRAGGGVPDDAPAAAPRRPRHRDARDRPAPDQREPGMGSCSEDRPPGANAAAPTDAPYRRLVGVGGIGTGMFFALEGNHDLGRNESRPGRLLDVRDYCKLHIVAQYPAVLLGAREDRGPFHVVPVGKVGIDEVGLRLRAEMERAGMDVRFVDAVPGRPTLLSVCFQYPDGSGGNVTTVDSAAALVERARRRPRRALARPRPRSPWRRPRCRSRSAATCCAGRPRRAPCGSPPSPRPRSRRRGRRASCPSSTSLSLNEDEAAALVGAPFPAEAPEPFLRALRRRPAPALQPGARLVVTAGARGAFAFDGPPGRTCPPSRSASSARRGPGTRSSAASWPGSRRACPSCGGGPRASLAERPLASALDLGVLVAAFKVTSPHTIPPDLSLDALARLRAGARRRLRRGPAAPPAGRRGAPPCPLRAARRDAARDARRLLRPLRDETSRPRAGARARGHRRRPAGRPRDRGPEGCWRGALRGHGIDVELYDTGFLSRSRHPFVRRDRNYRGRHNLVARAAGHGPRPQPPPERPRRHRAHAPEPLARQPVVRRIRRGRLYGRGSWDMKGGLAAQCAVAMALRKAGLRLGRRPPRRVGGGRGVRGRRRDARRRGCAGRPPTPARSPSPRTRRCCAPRAAATSSTSSAAPATRAPTSRRTRW